jgi:hypothetical protein
MDCTHTTDILESLLASRRTSELGLLGLVHQIQEAVQESDTEALHPQEWEWDQVMGTLPNQVRARVILKALA